MDQDRIVQIARAMCRAARMDPDKPPAIQAIREDMRFAQTDAGESLLPAWRYFQPEAAAFVARHRLRTKTA
ncbi:hypothetical protein [Bosea psychrotolerans]|uniref:Uncharacterized protein n=1 Tax=Bosea psychrotolerans TaxID=1871628 RepID=A0A2S4MEU6_9HYPH|nr:hypothetical protein [Bosea psychrotolerans]POR53145.1 hypothetical protein CYD53_104120 [Bosea psychrotolerans]